MGESIKKCNVTDEERELFFEKVSQQMEITIGQVWYCLKNYPETREDDGILLIRWLEHFKLVDSWGSLLRLAHSHSLRPETLRRSRQKIQEHGYYLPQTEKVLKRRRLTEVYERFSREAI